MFASAPCLQAIKSQPFKRSQLGLFQLKTKQYGNNVPFSLKKTRRTWLPNVQSKRLTSEVLDKTFKLKVTTRALATVKKYGGLDSYLTKSSPSVLGHEGMRLRALITDRIRENETPSSEEATNLAIKAGRSTDQSVADRVVSLHSIFTKPSLQSARLARLEAAKALGGDEPLSANRTLAYLRKVKPRTAGLSCTRYTITPVAVPAASA